MTASDLVKLLDEHRFSVARESDLQQGIALVLERAGVAFEREVRLTAADRIDFLIGDVGIECKIDGSLGALIRQVERYALHERIGEIVVATTRRRLIGVPREMHEKCVHPFLARGGLL